MSYKFTQSFLIIVFSSKILLNIEENQGKHIFFAFFLFFLELCLYSDKDNVIFLKYVQHSRLKFDLFFLYII